MPLAAALQNSHQDGGGVFLIFVADPRTARLCNSDRFGSTGRRLGDRVRGEAVGAEGRCPLPVLPSTDWSSTGGRFRSRCACEARRDPTSRRRDTPRTRNSANPRRTQRCLPRDADVRRRRQNHQARGRNLLQHPRRWGRYGPTDAPERRVVARIYWWRHWGSRAESSQ